jgi:hypothetical protein
MFGHDDHNNDTNQTTPEVHVNEALLEPENLEPGAAIEDHAAAVENAPGAVEVTPSDAPSSNIVAPVVITPPAPSATDDDTVVSPTRDDDASTKVDPNDPLLGIKRDALQALSPLLSHLDQTPEEKFRTTMMLIQATDNKDLLGDAYSAAKDIGDEKVRAQALLDVVNEINYFTTQAK